VVRVEGATAISICDRIALEQDAAVLTESGYGVDGLRLDEEGQKKEGKVFTHAKEAGAYPVKTAG